MYHSLQLKNFIDSLSDFKIIYDKPHSHMAATIVDGILQAGLNYNYVVKPRIDKIKINFPELSTTSAFYNAILENKLEAIANWTNPVKLNRIQAVTKLFIEEKIENEFDLGDWLADKKNEAYFKQLNGIGDKTADYFKILAGKHSVAIDRHLIGFLNLSGIEITINEYQKAHNIITETAKILNLEPEVLDHSIWKYMSTKKSF